MAQSRTLTPSYDPFEGNQTVTCESYERTETLLIDQSIGVSDSARTLVRALAESISEATNSIISSYSFILGLDNSSDPVAFDQLSGTCRFSKAVEVLGMEIINAIDSEPVEDGYDHAAEKLLDSMLKNHPAFGHRYIRGKILGENYSLSTNFLKLLGRLDELPIDWFSLLISESLESSSVEIRDAAIQAAENFDDERLVSVLSVHKEPCAWLNDYLQKVIEDLQG